MAAPLTEEEYNALNNSPTGESWNSVRRRIKKARDASTLTDWFVRIADDGMISRCTEFNAESANSTRKGSAQR